MKSGVVAVSVILELLREVEGGERGIPEACWVACLENTAADEEILSQWRWKVRINT